MVMSRQLLDKKNACVVLHASLCGNVGPSMVMLIQLFDKKDSCGLASVMW